MLGVHGRFDLIFKYGNGTCPKAREPAKEIGRSKPPTATWKVHACTTPSTVFTLCVEEERNFGFPDKMKAVQNYPVPKNVRDVRAFLGLASFYRRLVQHFAEMARPLTRLTRKTQEFYWVPE
jgi:hypothetical protein